MFSLPLRKPRILLNEKPRVKPSHCRFWMKKKTDDNTIYGTSFHRCILLQLNCKAILFLHVILFFACLKQIDNHTIVARQAHNETTESHETSLEVSRDWSSGLITSMAAIHKTSALTRACSQNERNRGSWACPLWNDSFRAQSFPCWLFPCALLLRTFRISIKTSTPLSWPRLPLFNPYKGLKLAVSSRARHSHSSLC